MVRHAAKVLKREQSAPEMYKNMLRRSRSQKRSKRRTRSGSKRLRYRGAAVPLYRGIEESEGFQATIKSLGFEEHMGQIKGLVTEWESVTDETEWLQWVRQKAQRAVKDAEKAYEKISLTPFGLRMYSGELTQNMHEAIKHNARNRQEWELALLWLLGYVSKHDILDDELSKCFDKLKKRFEKHPNFDANVITTVRQETYSTQMRNTFVLNVINLYLKSVGSTPLPY